MPELAASFDTFDPSRDLTVVIPTHNRTEYFLHYLSEGLWDDVPILIVCDGCDATVLDELKEATRDRNITVLDYQPRRGVAHAIGVGVRNVQTSHFMFCGDDDFNVNYAEYLEEAAEVKARYDDVLFVTMPYLYSFNTDLQFQLQYDRTSFEGKTGREILRFLVETGEMRSLVAGSLFRVDEVRPVLPEPVFTVSEDFVLLARLCASHPDRRVYVTDEGRRMRLIHDRSLSARSRFSLEKAVLNLISMSVGAHYLVKFGDMTRDQFAHILLRRGEVLQRAYGLGTEAATFMAQLVQGMQVTLGSEEQMQTLSFLQAHKTELPPEWWDLMPEYGREQITNYSQATEPHSSAGVE